MTGGTGEEGHQIRRNNHEEERNPKRRRRRNCHGKNNLRSPEVGVYITTISLFFRYIMFKDGGDLVP